MFNTKIKKVITIEGMMCEHCKMKVNLKNKTATIYSTKSISNDDIKNSISKLDYKIVNIGEKE